MDRGTRIHQKESYAKRQQKIAKAHGSDVKSEKHCSTSAFPCSCWMCGNPRKFFDEPTIQEKRLFQDLE